MKIRSQTLTAMNPSRLINKALRKQRSFFTRGITSDQPLTTATVKIYGNGQVLHPTVSFYFLTSQALFEALAEALGYHANQIPMRLVAQRLPWKKLRGLSPETRQAHLFGLAGFLPNENAARLQQEPRAWLRELWEIWWKARTGLDYALLPKSQWKLAGQRPLNRPERRLAALAQLVPRLSALQAAVEAGNRNRFKETLRAIHDPFWEKHATLTGTPLGKPCRLIGEDRIADILVNIFWPLVSLDQPEAARLGLEKESASPNSAGRIASQRLLLSALTPKLAREALVQQGLLQIFRDYCQTDCSQCRDCTFPKVVETWETA